MLAVTVTVAVVLAGAAGCRDRSASSSGDGDEISGELIVFHAGSLTGPFDELLAMFEAEHPGIDVKAEAAGSRQCARKISDLHRPCDVMASADYRVVASLLAPDHASFNIHFATNEMVVAYTDSSIGSEAISADNWHEVLTRPDVLVGRSDANSDPCGYRALMVFQLAEKYYGLAGLAQKLDDRCRHIRPKETNLLALLKRGEVDYLLIYRSVATQHGLRMVLLPDEVNLESPDMAELYATASVRLSGSRPGEFITRTGGPITYSVTIPHSSANPAAAEAFVALLLSPAGRAVMERHGQGNLVHAIADGFNAMPPGLQLLCRPGPAEAAVPGATAMPATAQVDDDKLVQMLIGACVLLILAGIAVAAFVKPFRGGRSSSGRTWFELLLALLGSCVLLLIVAPLLGMMLATSMSDLSQAAADEEVIQSIKLTLLAAFFAVAVSAVAGVPLAYLLARKQFWGKEIVLGVIDLPIVIPHSAAGIALLTVIGRQSTIGRLTGGGLVGTAAGIAVAMAFVSIPFLVNAARQAFLAVPERLERAARTLGASPARVFLTVSLPMAWRGVLSGMVLMWARGISEFGAVVIIAYHPMTTPVMVFQRFNDHGLRYAVSVAVLLIAVCITLFVVLRILSRAGRKEAERA